MTPKPLTTPVVLLIFNRPDTTARVLENIARVRPARLFVVADGPRPNKPGEAEKCAAARQSATAVDWECDVRTNFADVNLGCRERVASGLDWVFEQTENAIILEDDCVPDASFFGYCEELLTRYRDNERIMHIGGTNLQRGRRRSADSYYFSRYNHCWGWATWRRAWEKFDMEMRDWPVLRENGWLDALLGNAYAASRWKYNFDRAYTRRVDSWAYRWTYACWRHDGLSVTPQVNLVTNVGYGAAATHTKAASGAANLASETLALPLRYPLCVYRNATADAWTQKTHFNEPLRGRVWGQIRQWGGGALRKIAPSRFPPAFPAATGKP